jgi:hypothetical protein
MKIIKVIGSLCLINNISAFAPMSQCTISSRSASLHADATDVAEAAESTTSITTDPKEAVKLFGRLAEKYIMLDATAGMCCYSACSDCEYREPGGGYRMADQSSARPKWIPCYDHREFGSGKEHTTKWSSDIFTEGPAVTKEQFVERLVNMEFVPPLGGPFLAKSAATIEDESAAAAFFDILAGEKEKLTRHRMGKEMKVLSGGEEGLTWNHFSKAMGAN